MFSEDGDIPAKNKLNWRFFSLNVFIGMPYYIIQAIILSHLSELNLGEVKYHN